jgi:alkanesulfonate monooxygenase SsuD/methylene tetrahydromethanopterin reductase-like flavin-dependent oxidoreductase (luciferase family)
MKIKFGVQVQQSGLSYDEFKRYFVTCEKLGFYSAFTNDHLHPPFNSEDTPIIENWILLSAIARETNKIRIGTQVNCNSFRYPSLLAKMAASLDVISDGRLEFMVGAGWFKSEYKGYGIPFPTLKIRIEQLKEAIQVIKLMWTEHKAYFKGKYYSLEGALNYPKPLQKPYPRIWIGGAGERIVRATAEFGEGLNLMGTPEDFEKKLGILKEFCEKSGRDYNSIEKSWTGDLVIGANEKEIERRLKKLKAKLTILDINKGEKKKTRSFEEIEGPSLVGTASQIIDKMEEYMKTGIDYFIIVPSSFRNYSDVKLFEEKVMRTFR